MWRHSPCRNLTALVELSRSLVPRALMPCGPCLGKDKKASKVQTRDIFLYYTTYSQCYVLILICAQWETTQRAESEDESVAQHVMFGRVSAQFAPVDEDLGLRQCSPFFG